jgi:hypothetical protein
MLLVFSASRLALADAPAPGESQTAPHVSVETGSVVPQGAAGNHPHAPAKSDNFGTAPFQWNQWTPADQNAALHVFGRFIFRADVGLGLGTAGIVGRVSPGAEIRLAPGWGVGAAFLGSLSGVTAPGLRGIFGLELRGFWETPIPTGSLRLQAGLAPALIGSTGNNCDAPLCGYTPPEPVAFGGLASFEVSYWFRNRPEESLGVALRGQIDTRQGVEVTANMCFGADILALANHHM